MMNNVSSAVAFAATLLGLIGAYIGLGGPLPATRGYLDEKLRPMECDLLYARKHINAVDLFTWQDHNPEPRPREIQETIDGLKSKIDEIGKRLQTEGC